MLKVKFTQELENEYYQINNEYSKLQNDWKQYADEIIPEDKEFAKKIIKFIIKIIDYINNNYDKLNVEDYQEFLAYYHYEFIYGPNGDDRNYLDLDETLDGELVTEFCWELKDDDFKLTKEKLEEIKSKYIQILSMF